MIFSAIAHQPDPVGKDLSISGTIWGSQSKCDIDRALTKLSSDCQLSSKTVLFQIVLDNIPVFRKCIHPTGQQHSDHRLERICPWNQCNIFGRSDVRIYLFSVVITVWKGNPAEFVKRINAVIFPKGACFNKKDIMSGGQRVVSRHKPPDSALGKTNNTADTSRPGLCNRSFPWQEPVFEAITGFFKDRTGYFNQESRITSARGAVIRTPSVRHQYNFFSGNRIWKKTEDNRNNNKLDKNCPIVGKMHAALLSGIKTR